MEYFEKGLTVTFVLHQSQILSVADIIVLKEYKYCYHSKSKSLMNMNINNILHQISIKILFVSNINNLYSDICFTLDNLNIVVLQP